MELMKSGKNTMSRQWTREGFTICWMVRGALSVFWFPSHDLVGVVETVAESSENITNTATFDTYRSLLKHHSHLKSSVMNKMLDSISSGLATQVDAAMHDIESEDQQTAMSHRLPLEMYCFLLQWFVSIADEGKPAEGEDPIPPPTKGRRGRGGKAGTGKATGGRGQSKKAAEQWSWADQIPAILALVSRTLRLKTKRVWTSTSDLDAFITYVLLNTPRCTFLTHA
jgi:condensin complex subunit 1